MVITRSARKGTESPTIAGEKHETEHDENEFSLTRKRAKQNGNKNGARKRVDTKSRTKHPLEKAVEKPTKAASGKSNDSHSDGNMPSSILEKGIMYFFHRGRVNIDSPDCIDDIARSYIVLRPIAKDARLGNGPIDDTGHTRLFILPKKALPQSGRDRFIMFCDKSDVSFSELKKRFLDGSDKETKTRGITHTPPATPVGEGVYAITATGRESHLTYILTLPEDLGEVQNELGLRSKGSFIISTRNPKYPAPKNVRLPEEPNFPKEWVAPIPCLYMCISF
jgi:hypothetical protein